jgi:predicted RecB family nuclease
MAKTYTAPENKARAALYPNFLAEREQILALKAQLSHATGEETSWETALHAWVKNGRSAWRKQQRKASPAPQ